MQPDGREAQGEPFARRGRGNGDGERPRRRSAEQRKQHRYGNDNGPHEEPVKRRPLPAQAIHDGWSDEGGEQTEDVGDGQKKLLADGGRGRMLVGMGNDTSYTLGAGPALYCGYTSCGGGCGLPVLVIPGQPELRLVGDSVALGLAFQPFRVPWTGSEVEAPPEHVDDFRKRMWQ